MKIVSFMNMKGGVGKTTLCVNIANTIASYLNKKVLVIDMDPQFNASQYVLRVKYGEEHINKYDEYRKQGKTIYHLYKNLDEQKPTETSQHEIKNIFNSRVLDDSPLKDNYTINIKENLDFILGDIDLIELQIMQKSGIEKILERHIELAKLRDDYDYIFIDSPPTYSFFFISSYLSCDTYVLPVKPDYLSSTGISLLSKAENSIVKTYGKKAPPLGIIFTLIDPRNHLHVPVIDSIENEIGNEHIFRNNLKYLKPIPEGLSKRQFMLDINEQDISKNIKLLADEFVSRLDKLRMKGE